MLSRRVKLDLTSAQVQQLDGWFMVCTGLWNWGLSKFDADGEGYRRFSSETRPPRWHKGASHPENLHLIPGTARTTTYGLHGILKGHFKTLEVPTIVLRGTIDDLGRGWRDWNYGKPRNGNPPKGKPRRKGVRNRLSSVCFKSGVRLVDPGHLHLPGVGSVKIHKQKDLPKLCAKPGGGNAIKHGRLLRMARGWYITLQIDAAPRTVPITDNLTGGMDPGFETLATIATLFSSEKIANPREYRQKEKRIGQAARGRDLRLVARLNQRLANAVRHRNHEISSYVVGKYSMLYISNDNLQKMARFMGKSVRTASFGDLRAMLVAKSRQAGRQVVMVSNYNSTRTCSSCVRLTGPRGKAGLSVRLWVCSGCGALHDRDVNAGVNTLKAGVAPTLCGQPPAARKG
jgi:transposase